jgi:hypothetical protein
VRVIDLDRCKRIIPWVAVFLLGFLLGKEPNCRRDLRAARLEAAWWKAQAVSFSLQVASLSHDWKNHLASLHGAD